MSRGSGCLYASEHVGTLRLKDGDRDGLSGVVIGMISDDRGTLHCLTDQPLELHSFYDVRRILTAVLFHSSLPSLSNHVHVCACVTQISEGVALGGELEKRYVRRKLMSEQA